MNPLSALYSTAVVARRRWYARNPSARRRLSVPVISVGNLVVGGSGKTPVVAALARLLLEHGQRPVILSRGYARRDKTAGVLVVSDGARVIEPVERSGDEPQMLARSLPGVPVLVSADRHAAGGVAAARFGCTVALLDDGFQHLRLARDLDLLLVDPRDLDERVLPGGRLREPVAAAAAASAVLVHGSSADAARVAEVLGVPSVFTVTRHYEAPQVIAPWAAPLTIACGPRVLAVAGIARPERFFTALDSQRWNTVTEMVFPDHRWFTGADVEKILAAARDARADLIMTTEKDAVRLEHLGTTTPPIAFLPMRATIEPADVFVGLVLAAAVTAPG